MPAVFLVLDAPAAFLVLDLPAAFLERDAPAAVLFLEREVLADFLERDVLTVFLERDVAPVVFLERGALVEAVFLDRDVPVVFLEREVPADFLERDEPARFLERDERLFPLDDPRLPRLLELRFLELLLRLLEPRLDFFDFLLPRRRFLDLDFLPRFLREDLERAFTLALAFDERADLIFLARATGLLALFVTFLASWLSSEA